MFFFFFLPNPASGVTVLPKRMTDSQMSKALLAVLATLEEMSRKDLFFCTLQLY